MTSRARRRLDRHCEPNARRARPRQRRGARARDRRRSTRPATRPTSRRGTLRARRSMMVLVMVPNITNAFFAEVLRGIDDELVASGYGIMIANLDNKAEREPRYVELAFAGQVDAVLLMSGRIPQGNGKVMTEAGVPIATICVSVGGRPRVDHGQRSSRLAPRRRSPCRPRAQELRLRLGTCRQPERGRTMAGLSRRPRRRGLRPGQGAVLAGRLLDRGRRHRGARLSRPPARQAARPPSTRSATRWRSAS